MEVPLLDLTAQYRAVKEELDEAVRDVVRAQAFVLGPKVEAFEEAMAEYVGVRHAVGCASGTDALLLPLWASDLPEGSGVVVPAFTFFATAGAVWNAGLRPVFADVDPETFDLTAETVETAWQDDVRALVPVHLFGQMAPMEELLPLAEERDAAVIEDAAQAVGARRATGGGDPGAGAAAGSLGTAGAFSFFPTKNLGAFGDGGLVTTDDDELAERLRKLRVHGGRQMYHHEMVGTNSRLDALQAAVLHAKLPHLEGWSEARRRNAALYDERLTDVPEVIPPRVREGNHHVYNQYTIRARRRDELREFLAGRGIGSGVYYPVPLHLQECFSELGYREGDLPVSETLSREVLSLPIFPELGRERVERVADAVREFYRGS